MIVRQLLWLSESSKEAELIISDGKYECVAFSHPCCVRVGDNLSEPLHAFIVKDLMISREKHCSLILIKPNGFSLRCVAEVVDPENGLVKVGDIKIIIEGKAPPSSLSGDLVEFSCVRLDVW